MKVTRLCTVKRAQTTPWLRRVPVQLRLIYTPVAFGFRAALRRAIQDIQPQVLHIHMPNVSAFWALTLISAYKMPWVVSMARYMVITTLYCLARWGGSSKSPRFK